MDEQGLQTWSHCGSSCGATLRLFILQPLLYLKVCGEFYVLFLSVISVASGDEECDSGVGKSMSWNDTTAAAWNISVFSLMNCSHLWIIKSRSVKTWRNILWRKSLKWMMVLQPGGVGEEGGGVMKDQPGHTYKKNICFLNINRIIHNGLYFRNLHFWVPHCIVENSDTENIQQQAQHGLTPAPTTWHLHSYEAVQVKCLAQWHNGRDWDTFFLFLFLLYFVTSYNRFSSQFHGHHCDTLVL